MPCRAVLVADLRPPIVPFTKSTPSGIAGAEWREKTMVGFFESNFAPSRRLTSYVFRPISFVSIDFVKAPMP